MNGAFVISLDFEMHWGVRDNLNLESYNPRLRSVKSVIPVLLDVFETYHINATWATVGMLFAKDKAHLHLNLPTLTPGYSDSKFNPYPEVLSIGKNEEEDPIRFGNSLIQLIKQRKGQEISTHTFSHYYCLEAGQKPEEFEADLLSAINIAKEEGLEVKSIVFPRNQYGPAYLDICVKNGLLAYRGNEKSKIYQPSKGTEHNGKLRRMARLADAYINLTGHHTFSWDSTGGQPLYNIPSSRFLRPYMPILKFAEPLRLKRITAGMTQAAKKGELFHLWWHPHNFGDDLNQNIDFLKKILDHFSFLQNKYGMESLNLAQTATRLTELHDKAS